MNLENIVLIGLVYHFFFKKEDKLGKFWSSRRAYDSKPTKMKRSRWAFKPQPKRATNTKFIEPFATSFADRWKFGDMDI